MTQAIIEAAIKAAKVNIMAIKEANNPIINVRLIHRALRSGIPALKYKYLAEK